MGLARQSLAERFIHCTCIWDLGQVPNQDTVLGVGWREMSLRQRGGNGTAVVANLFYETRLKRQTRLTHELTLMTRTKVQEPCHRDSCRLNSLELRRRAMNPQQIS